MLNKFTDAHFKPREIFMNNPLLEKHTLPPFNDIKPEQIEPAVDAIMQSNREAIKALLQQKQFTWQTLLGPLEDLEDRLNSAWSIASQLLAVINSEPLRQAYNACLPKISDYSTEISQNEQLFQAIKQIAENPDFNNLQPVQQKIIQEELRDFHLAGVDLEPTAKKRFAELEKRLSELMNTFNENVLDATQGWSRLVEDETELKGIPLHAQEAAKENAAKKNLKGWLFTLNAPSYLAVMTYAESRALREEMYKAYVTRASDQGPNAGKWDNSAVMQEILQIREELARLLNFKSYAELSLATKTAKHPAEVLQFLNELCEKSRPIAEHEFKELQEFAQKKLGLNHLQPWDMTYASEKLQQEKFNFSDEQLRCYFPEDHVLAGLFNIVNQLFGIHIVEKKGVPIWHNDVRFFEVYDENQNLLGEFYADLYARENKRSGAWMAECRARRRLANGDVQVPIAFLNCNFASPTTEQPALFTHDDVTTLFHEFGHTLHELLSKVDYASASGTSNVPWDVVEVPSQFLENWCWEKKPLQMLAKHYKTGEHLPDDLLKQLRASKTFQIGMQTLRQLEFALFDFRIHMEFDPNKPKQIAQIMQEVRAKTSLYPVPDYNRFERSFSHIFGGGYAAGYYSYKWAEVWASDAFSLFEEQGILDKATGKKFLQQILEKGSSEDPLKMFIAFRGREPQLNALLQHIKRTTIATEGGGMIDNEC